MSIKRYYRILTDLLVLFLIAYILIPSYVFQLAVGPIYLSIDRFLFLVLLAYWLFGLMFLPKVFVRMVNVILSQKVLFIFYFISQIILFVSSYLSGEVASLNGSIYFILYTLVLTLIAVTIPLSAIFLNKLSNIFLFVSIVLIIVSFFEIIMGTNPLAPFVDINKMTEMQKAAFSDINMDESIRIKGTFSNPLTFGQFVVLVVPILFFLKKYNTHKTIVNLTIVLLTLAGLLTRSRATFIIIMLTFLFAAYYYFKSINFSKRVLFVFLFSFIIIALVSLNPDVTSFFGGKELTRDQNRETQLTNAVPLILNKPYFGYGQGQGTNILDYGTLSGGSPTIDNYFLSCVLDCGIIGLIFGILFFFKVLFLFRVPRNYLPIYFGLIFFIINLFTLSLTEVHPIFYFVLSILILLIYHEKKRSRSFS